MEKDAIKTKTVRTWYGRKKTIVIDDDMSAAFDELTPEKRPTLLYAPIYNGLAAGLAVCAYFFRFCGFYTSVNADECCG